MKEIGKQLDYVQRQIQESVGASLSLSLSRSFSFFFSTLGLLWRSCFMSLSGRCVAGASMDREGRGLGAARGGQP